LPYNFRYLAGIDISDADLHYADLNGADLSGANLGSADLIVAGLTRVNLGSADLSNAGIEEAIGINIGPTRTFIGIPFGCIEARSPFVPGRTTLRRTE